MGKRSDLETLGIPPGWWNPIIASPAIPLHRILGKTDAQLHRALIRAYLRKARAARSKGWATRWTRKADEARKRLKEASR